MKLFDFITKKSSLFTSLAIVSVGLFAFGLHKVNADVIKDCTPNSIIRCGTNTPRGFIAVARTNGVHDDLQSIYDRFGLSTDSYDQFASHAVQGIANQDGTIEVDGQTVATDAWSIGRTHFSYAKPFNNDGKTYFWSMNNQVLQQSLPVMVMFNPKGQMQFAVMNSCGNPTMGTAVKPKFSCDLLKKSKVQGMSDTFDFSTVASASDNAKVVKVVYDFGDGSNNVVATSLTKKVRHTFAPGTWTVRVTVFVSLPGSQTVTITSASCEKQVSIAQPFFQCEILTPFTLDKEKRQFRFIATTNQGNGATLKDASFDFGDGSSESNVSPSTDKTVVADHTFATDGTFAITATVNFDTPTGVQSDSCATQISPKITPAVVTSSTPPKLVNSGPGGTAIGLFAVSSTVAGVGYRIVIRRFIR